METYHVEQAVRRRIAIRLLPFVFLLYAIQYVDRVNVSFANEIKCLGFNLLHDFSIT